MKNANSGMKNGYSSSNGNKLNTNNDDIYNSFSAKVKNNRIYYNYAVSKKDELVGSVYSAANELDNKKIKES